MYTYKVEQAIKAAALLHQDQLRKGEIALPYVTHLISVMLIVRDYSQDEATLVAALLHDTLEDTDYTLDELKADFGDEVAGIVLTLTEPQQTPDVKVPWLEVKKTYAQQLRKGSEKAVLIAAADKAHNFRSIIEEYYEEPKRYTQDFGHPLDKCLEGYQAIANAINSRLKDGIVHEFNHTYEQFKTFILNVQASQRKESSE